VLDKLGPKQPLHLPSAGKTFNSSSNMQRLRTLQRDMTFVPDTLKERVASVLASEFSKKVVHVNAVDLAVAICMTDAVGFCS
jgi:hypothetical protein